MSLHFRNKKKRTERPVYWENTSNDSQKFWAAHILEQNMPDNSATGESTSSSNSTYAEKQYILVRKWGRIGTKGQSMEQMMYDRNEAEKELDKLIYLKESKGYEAKF